MTSPGYEWCQVNIILTLTKDSLPNSDGFVTWTDQLLAPVSTLTATEIVFNTVVYNVAYIGVYSVSLEYTWSTASTSTQAFTFTVNDPCSAAITPPDPSTIPNYGPVWIGDADFVQSLAPNIAIPQ